VLARYATRRCYTADRTLQALGVQPPAAAADRLLRIMRGGGRADPAGWLADLERIATPSLAAAKK
jgi:hypothetical protein